MNRLHSFADQVAEFVAGQDLELVRSGEGTCFSGTVTSKGGVDVSLCISCVGSLLVRVTSTLPVAAPVAVHGDLVRVLNVINLSVPCGAFILDPENGCICLDMGAMVPQGEHPGAQLRWLLFLSAEVMHIHAVKLIGAATGTLTAEDALALLSKESAAEELPAEPDPERFRWN